jgi:hypothetical protein
MSREAGGEEGDLPRGVGEGSGGVRGSGKVREWESGKAGKGEREKGDGG